MSSRNIARARAHSNIAFIKYWGNRDHRLRLPANASISMNLAALHTTTEVEWSDEYSVDTLRIDGVVANDAALARVSAHLDELRRRLATKMRARVDSRNNFPMGAGMASSASAFAALTLAATAALLVDLEERELSSLARLGSGSAARSIPGGYVEWLPGDSHDSSYAATFVQSEHWNLVDVIAIVNRAHKRVGSTAGHASADTSVLQDSRLRTAPTRLEELKQAIVQRDFPAFAQITEEDSNLMHAVMMTSRPPLFYWQPLSLEIMAAVRRWREAEGLNVCYTLDAGPNVHCIALAEDAARVAEKLRNLSDELEIAPSRAGGGAVVLCRGLPLD